MEDKQAANILLQMLEKHSFSEEEKEAVSTAIGILSWTSLAQSRLKNRVEKKKKELE